MVTFEQKHFLILYDICDPKRLKKVAAWLENFAYRVQYSVFEAELDEKTLNKIIKGLRSRIDDFEDSVFIFPICETDWQKRERYGMNDNAEELYNQKYAIL